MSDNPLDYKAFLARKGLDGTGVDENLAREMSNNRGSHTLLIIDARHEEVTIGDKGTTVKLIATNVQPVPSEHEDTVREFMRAIHRNNPAQRGQAALTGVDEGAPSLTDTANAVKGATDEMAERRAAKAAEDGIDPEADPDGEGPWPGDPGYVAPDPTDG